MDDDAQAGRPVRLMTFVSEEQLDQAKKARGERADDGTAQRDRPLFEILKENRDKKDAEFNERFKHRPPKALDEDETEFLDNWEMSKKAHERQVADEEAEQLRRFQEAVAAQSSMVHEIKEIPAIPRPEVMFPQEQKLAVKRNKPAFPGNFTISIKPQAKKAKAASDSDKSEENSKSSNEHAIEKKHDEAQRATGGLVSYSDESDDD